MSKIIITQDAGNGNRPVQIGPPWRCFECGAPVARTSSYRQWLNPRAAWKALDDWADHIHYLHLDCNCKTHRVARLGDAITPLDLPINATEPEKVALLQDALAAIAQVLGPNPRQDPLVAIVYRLVAGDIAPATAITQLRNLTHAAQLQEAGQ